MANKSDISRDAWMLKGPLAKKGYDWWWHSFTARNMRTGEEKPFYIEFFTCNPDICKENVQFGQKGEIPSYLMVNCGTWGKDARQIHRFFPWSHVNMYPKAPFAVNAADCELSETHTKGSVCVTKEENDKHPEWMSDCGKISWDLKIDKKTAFHVGYGAGSFLRALNAFEMAWHAEGMKTEFEGWVTLDDEKYLVMRENCYGYADKNWGQDFTSPWVWLSGNHMTSRITGKELKDSVFDIGGGCPKVFGIPLKRKLLSDFWYEGKDYEFNFSKFWTFTRTKFDCHETEKQVKWHVEQKTWNTKMVTDVSCEKDEMLKIRYEAPNGKKLHNNLWNGGNGKGNVKLYEKKKGSWLLIDDIAADHIGCEYGDTTKGKNKCFVK